MSVRILYIDDDVALARLTTKALASAGISVTHAATSREALPLAVTGQFDAIALDHDLISETGLEVIPRILAINNAPPIIYVTGSDDARTAVSALKAGAVDYVWKDVEGHYRELLAQSVRSAVAQRRLQREKEEAQRAIAAAKERAELLLSEVNHRVANSLTLVASLASMQAGATDNAATKAALNEMKVRIVAIANIHKRLYTSSDVRFVALDLYLQNLCSELLAVSGPLIKQISVQAEPAIKMSTDRAISLGIVVTELVTNAMKYAYPEATSGEVRVGLCRLEAGRCELIVEDDGVGWQGEGTPTGSGLGSRLIRSLAAALDGALTYVPSTHGTRAQFIFSLELARE